MTKTLRNIIIVFCGMFAFLFAGFFFVGCGIDYSKIQLVCETGQSIDIDVGESVNLTFKIENSQSGFNNKVKVNKISNAGSEVFSCSDPVYLDNNRIKVTVTGVAGGTGKLQLVTIEGGKTCTVDVSVNQYSSGMNLNSKVLYVSNDTPFEPNANMFEFDGNTTNKDVTYFYINSGSVIDVNTYSLVGVDLSGSVYKATFLDESGYSVEVDVFAFNKIELRKVDGGIGDELWLIRGENESRIAESSTLESTFKFFAVYNFSMNEDGSVNKPQYENLIHVVSEVYVLPSLNVRVMGGYVETDGYVHGSDTTDGDMDFDAYNDKNIRIVPNNSSMKKFILKIQMDNYVNGLPVELLKIQENSYVDVDFCEYTKFGEADPDNTAGVYYFKITQNVQTQTETDLKFQIFYNIAQGIDDESVNVELDFTINVEIAPIGILVNGTSEPEKTIMYNIYNFPQFGWNELNFDVISGLESSPSFEGVYFTFDSGYLEVMQNGLSVENDLNNASGKVYKNLNTSFYIRGAYKCSTIEEVILTVHLKSDILSGSARELTLEIPFEIVQGADMLAIDTAYQSYDNTFYMDYDAGKQKFDNVLCSNAFFQDVSNRHVGGIDVVEIECDDLEPCLAGNFLNLSITPKTTGTGKYRLYLDNGVYVELIFNVIKTLTTEKDAFALSDYGNEMVTNFVYTSSGAVEYNDQISIDILNSNVDGEVQFGSVANLNVVANLGEEGVKFSVVNGTISRSQSGISHRFATVENGNAEVKAELSGYTVENFARIAKKTYYTLYFASYSLIQEFNIRNTSGNLALSNKVYYGSSAKETDKTVTFSPHVDNERTFGFYKYNFTQEAFVNAFENSSRIDGVAEEIYKYTVKENEIKFDYCYEFYDQKFVYFNFKYFRNEVDARINVDSATITATVKKGGVSKQIKLTIPSDVMFYPENCVFEYNGENYEVSFDELKYETRMGDFDIETLSYRNKFTSGYTLEFSAFIRQRNLTKHYDLEIDAIKYQPVESISLSSSVTKLNFSNDQLTYDLGIYTYPQTSTNKNIVVEFVRTQENPYNILSAIVDESEKENGIYTVRLSCEEFFNNPSLRDNKNIVDIEENLTGKVYIFPSEWGNSYTTLSSDLQPIEIDVQYRNGSKNNPYLLETAQDFLIVNTNRTTLNSHYEVNAVIDMSKTSGFVPLGIVDGEVVGFGGSIVGSTSQASIQNIFVSDSNFALTTIDNKTYAGLFAQINDGAVVENISFSSKFDLNLNYESYVGTVTGVNKGLISNVGVTVNSSTINTNGNLFYGAVSGINIGKIIQNIDKYDTEEKGYDYLYSMNPDGVTKEDVLDSDGNKILADENNAKLPLIRNLKGQQPKTLAYFNDFVTINVSNSTVNAGGIAGASSGTIERIVSDDNTLKMYGYTAYSAYSLIKVVGTTGAVYVGGAVGVASFNSGVSTGSKIPETYLVKYKNLIGNLLVGGEISTLNLNLTATNDKDYVGGIVGYVDSLKIATIGVYGNISRTFLRGQNYVGGIVGFDQWKAEYGDDNISKYYLMNSDSELLELERFKDRKNSIEAIDDVRNMFYSSMIIKSKNIDGFNKAKIYALYVIGNAMEASSTRYYENTVGTIFTTYFNVWSFSEREKVSYDYNGDYYVDSTTSVSDTASVIDSTYGDYIVVEKDGRDYKLKNQFFFDRKLVDVGLDDSRVEFKMNGDASCDVYFMYYFSVEGYLNNGGAFAQDDIEQLNTISANSSLYPFALKNDDATFTSETTEILSMDMYGNITLKSQGLAVIDVTNIKNRNKSRKIYVYVINYFNKNVESSIYYTSKSMNGQVLTDNSTTVVYGSSNTNVYLIPSYKLECNDYDSEVKVSDAGVLRYKNVDYVISKNVKITSNVELDESSSDYFSKVQVNKQTIMFYKSTAPAENDIDKYTLTPMLKISIDEHDYVYEISHSKINLDVVYREIATQMYTDSNFVLLKSNGLVKDKVTVVSENKDEKIYYQIFYKDKDNNNILVQDRLPKAIGKISDSDWSNYVNFGDGYNSNSNQLKFFELTVSQNVNNTFEFGCAVNKNSDRFLNRFEEDIYGEYTIHFYSSDMGLAGGASCSFKIRLEETEVVNVDINNYSNINDIAVADNKLIPSQNGLLEISIDPSEAIFEDITISNSAKNYLAGATSANLTFAYEKNTLGSIEYVLDPNFGTYANGALKFSYSDLQDRIAEINESLHSDAVSYTGKVYVAYFMPSRNVADATNVGFDVVVNYANEQNISVSIDLVTKLNSYVKLSFEDRQAVGEAYYVARGLEYNLLLESYGFNESQITVSSNSPYAEIVKIDGKYKLKITDDWISYNNDIGYAVEITTCATKKVDNIEITAESIMKIYIMEYVVNYSYVEGVNEDIVKGMEDGIVNVAVGNPFVFEFDIKAFLEYDETIGDVQSEVDLFVSSMTNNICWSVYYNGESTTLEVGKEFKTQHYKVSGLTIVPLIVYSADSDIYHFSADARYMMYQGRYYYNSVGEYRIYTEFEFDVHNQSTENSPIPIYTYEEFIAMEDDEWYILLNDIVIPNTEYSDDSTHAFKPIKSVINGLDGNGHKIYLSGEYDFSGLSNIGLFENIKSGTIVQNVTIVLSGDTKFKVDGTAFNVGLLTARNEGVVTNCEISAINKYALSVIYSTQKDDKKATNSYVAGLIARNSGYVTHSRSKINIYCDFNLAGLVAINDEDAVIASSYFMGGRLKNQTNDNEIYTAGLVVLNNGNIYTSYVSGTPSANKAYYDNSDGTDNYILSSNNISGFVYTNSGQIYDCYSNIQLEYSGAYASGFVFENSGRIERCISTSVLENEQSKNYGFARVNNLIDDENDTGVILNCFYLKDDDQKINQSITQIGNDEVTDIRPLSLNQLKEESKFENYFSDFVYTSGRNINSVWFFNSKSEDLSNFNGQTFNTNRLELVAPNIIAHSERVLEGMQTVTEGEYTYVRYIYTYKVGTDALGSQYNPILISDAEKMEEYILQENNRSGYNYSYYRIISDIDYDDYLFNSKLYTTKFVGYLEGNFMNIDNISFVTSEALKTAGMFAEIGKTGLVNANGTVMNLTIRPISVSFANTQVVGALAGIVDGGNIFNVNIEKENADQLISVGQNIVGGGIGLAIGKYKIQKLYTQLSAKARNQEVASTDTLLGPNSFVKESADYTKYSFAGSVVGVLSGTGKFIDGNVDTSISVIGDKAGLAFGLIDNDVVVNNVSVAVNQSMLVNAYSYGGLVAGESKGNVSNVEVSGNDTYFTNFKKVPTVSIAVGGYAGIMSGGRLTNVCMKQSIQISDTSSGVGIEKLGGIAGIIESGVTMKNIVVDADFVGFKCVGGVAGVISTVGRVNFENVVVDSCLAVYGLKVSDIGIGGLAGETDTDTIVSLKTSYTDDVDDDDSLLEQGKVELSKTFGYKQNIFNIEVETNMSVYNEEVRLYVGTIIGADKARVLHDVSDTIMAVSGDCVIKDFGGAYSTVVVKLVKNNSGENASIDIVATEEEDKKRISHYIYNATRTQFDAQLNFTSMKGSDKMSTLALNLFGVISNDDLMVNK